MHLRTNNTRARTTGVAQPSPDYICQQVLQHLALAAAALLFAAPTALTNAAHLVSKCSASDSHLELCFTCLAAITGGSRYATNHCCHICMPACNS
jgi:ABC-type proline/glycine betaine transport system permease subunit